MSAMALLSPTAGHRFPTTNEAVTRGCRVALSWTVHRHGNLVRITLDGELDHAAAPTLDVLVRPLAEAGRDLVVGVAGLRFCDCSGLTLFERWQSLAAVAGGSLRLAAPSRIVRRLLTLTDTLDLLTITDRGR